MVSILLIINVTDILAFKSIVCFSCESSSEDTWPSYTKYLQNTNSDSFYSEFAGTTELGEHSWVLQLSKYLIIHTLSWILYLKDSLESIPLEKLQIFLFFLNLSQFSSLFSVFFFPETKPMSILSFICFQCISNGIFPKIYIKLNLKGQTCKKWSQITYKIPWNLQI